jgi:outer membrane protein assembly factor BamB
MAQTGGAQSLITKQAIWKQPLGGAVIGTPSTQVESVVVVCDGGNLKAYTRQGVPLWEYFAQGRLTPYLTRSREGTSYICRTNGHFIAINRVGRELWRVNLGAPLTGQVLIGWDGRLFIPTEKKIFCYAAAGSLLWYQALEHSIALNLREDTQGGFITVLDNGELLQISPFGEIRPQQLVAIPAVVVPITTPENGYGLLILYKNGDTELRGGSYPPPPPLPASPLAAAGRNGRVAMVLADGRVLLLSVAEGGILWTKESNVTPEKSSGNPVEETGMCYDERGIYMLSKFGAAGFTEDGQRLWFIRLLGAASPSAFSDEGLLYSGGKDWILYAYGIENRVRFREEKLYGPAPEGNYGLGNPLPPRRSDYYNRFNETGLQTQLTFIDKRIRAGRVGADEPYFTTYLMEVAGSVRNSLQVSSVRPPVHFQHRIEAVRLLSSLGSRELLPFLADLFTHDPEPLVKVAAAHAIGRIGVDPEGVALEAFANALFPPGALVKDVQALIAVATAVGSLCRFSGPPLSDTGVKLLIALGGSEKPLPVRNRARQEILSLYPGSAH